MTQMVKLINKKKFATAALDVDNKSFMVHVIALDIEGTNIALYHFWAAQIRLLKTNKTSTTVLTKYSYYTDVFLFELVAKLPEHTGINNYAIKLDDNK